MPYTSQYVFLKIATQGLFSIENKLDVITQFLVLNGTKVNVLFYPTIKHL